MKEMKDLAEGSLPNSGSEVVIYHDEEEDLVVVQLDFMDLHFYSSDFARLVEILNKARLQLEGDLEF